MIKLLVVDDEAGICEIIKKTFTYIGFTVFTATKAQKALEIVKKERPKIIFLDIIMEDMSGMELLKKVKEIDKAIIAIMVTMKKDKETKEEAKRLGADEFIEKPFSRNYLRDIVVKKIQDLLDKGGHMQKSRILIVDDEKETRDTLRDFISLRFEADIDEASEGAAAIEKVKKDQPDVILLDIKMPGISGIDVIDEIKKLSPGSKTMVISAWKSAEVASKAVKAGAVDYLEKPLSLSILEEKLRTLLIGIGKLIIKKS